MDWFLYNGLRLERVIVNYEHMSHIFLVFPLLTFEQIISGWVHTPLSVGCTKSTLITLQNAQNLFTFCCSTLNFFFLACSLTWT